MPSIPKPPKGSALIERKDKRKSVVSLEDAEKAKVRLRDKRCRWPHCANCRTYKPRLEVAHVIEAKKMGGDHGLRSAADQMMLLDCLTHYDQERHRRMIVPLTADGTHGPCEFWAEDRDAQLYLVARESAPFQYERVT